MIRQAKTWISENQLHFLFRSDSIIETSRLIQKLENQKYWVVWQYNEIAELRKELG